MGKILESLPLTIVAGVILTVIMIFGADVIQNSQMSVQEAPASEAMNSM